MRILITNDDGIRAPGLLALTEAFAGAGHEVLVCAPDRERSAASHSGTFDRPLRAEPMELPHASKAWAVDGTPSDCASLGLFLAGREGPVDMVVSGINRGMNLGGACIYSGTVAAAMEAAMSGVPGLAVSLCVDPRKGGADENYETAARVALRVAHWMPEHPLPLGAMYSLNVPTLPYEALKGLVPATLAPVFLDVPRYDRTEDGGWRYCGDFRTFDDPEYDIVKIGHGYCTLTKLTWNLRLNADDGELGEIGL